jgi:ABC-2 type transport system permease protein
MWGYTAIMSSLTELLAMVGDIAEKVKGPLFPFYHMGRSAEGKPLSFLIFAGIVLGIFLLVYLLLSHSFLSLATTNKGAAKKAYKRERTAQKSVGKALLGKELKRFVASPTYMLNCGLGALFLPIAGVVMLVFRADIQIVLPVFAELFGNADVVPLLLAAVACTMGAMVDITAPSVSLEGKHIWILQTLPVNAAQVLHAKLKLHLLIAVPPTAFAVICLLIATTPSLPFCFLIPLATLLFTALIALFGLFMNLKAPNLAWVNETVPVKQSLSVTVTLFGGWGFVFGLGALYIPLHGHIAPALYMGLCCVILAAACACLFHWINTKGAKIFAQL